VSSSCPSSAYRSPSGECNNEIYPEFGASGQPWYDFGVGFHDRLGDDLPLERIISNHLYYIEFEPLNRYNISLAEVFFGQFLNHDQELNLDDHAEVYHEKYRILVTEDNDELRTVHPNLTYMNLSYSMPYNTSVPFSFVNLQTSYLDLSTVYGFNQNMTDALRSFVDGKLLSKDYVVCEYDDNPPPFGPGKCTSKNITLKNYPASEIMTGLSNDLGLNAFGQDKDQLFSCGDIRCNENIALALFHVAFFREHNKNAEMLKNMNFSTDDEILFQEARRVTIAVYQNIIFREYLPTIIGKEYFKSIAKNYSGYDNNTNPGTSHIFAGAAFRYGHSSLREYHCLDDKGCFVECVPKWTPAYYGFPPTIMPVIGSLGPHGYTIPDMIVNAGGINNLIYSLVYQQAGEIDNYIDNSFRNLGKGFIPLDIAAADIARGRINGLPDYHTLRSVFFDSIYGKENCTFNSDKNITDPVECFLYITKNITKAENLKLHYYRVDHIDPIVGMFFEDHESDSPVGPTMARIILKEYERKRNADRFWFENQSFDPVLLNYIKDRSLVKLFNENFGTSLTSFLHVMEMPTCPIQTSTQSTVPPMNSAASSTEVPMTSIASSSKLATSANKPSSAGIPSTLGSKPTPIPSSTSSSVTLISNCLTLSFALVSILFL